MRAIHTVVFQTHVGPIAIESALNIKSTSLIYLCISYAKRKQFTRMEKVVLEKFWQKG